MPEESRLQHLIECLVHVIGRVAVPDERLREIVDTGPKQIIAFNLCDGSLGLSEVAKKAGLNKGNLSRAAKRWVQEGAAFWIGEGQNARLLHLYPLAKQVGSRKLKPSRDRRSRRRG